eukprot:m.118864 g.118864  ORF g.118864 m.118864 type:complete len:501 (-) comp10995_c0_seq2:1304-2806(-)
MSALSHATRPLPPLQRVPAGAPRSLGKPRSGKAATSAKQRSYLQPATARNSPRQNACLESLASGHVETFINMFKITEGDTEGATIADSTDMLSSLKDGLIGAENATRKGDLEAVYMAYKRLADYFEDSEQLLTSKDFRLKAQDAAKDLGHRAWIVDGYSLLGRLEDKLDRRRDAVQCYQAAFDTACASSSAADGDVDTRLPASHLVRARTHLADELLESGDADTALSELTSALSLATEFSLGDLAKECCYRLGRACESLGDPHAGIGHLEKYVNSPAVDQVGKNYACNVLARCYEQIGGDAAIDTAIQYLRSLIPAAVAAAPAHEDQLTLAMHAAAMLGRLYGDQGRHGEAIERYTEAYNLAKQVNDLEMIQTQQVALGMARANAMMGYVARGYAHNTPRDLDVMLRWGSLRQEGFSGGAIETGFPGYNPDKSKPTRLSQQPHHHHHHHHHVLHQCHHGGVHVHPCDAPTKRVGASAPTAHRHIPAAHHTTAHSIHPPCL